MYRITLGLKHELPFANLSRRFPRVLVYRWCNSTVDYLEVDCRSNTCADVSGWLKTYSSQSGFELVYEYTSPTHMSVIVNCRCNAQNSTLRLAESYGCLWVAPVTYLGGEESFDLLVFDYDRFQKLFSEYERLGDAVVKRKVYVPANTLRDSFAVSLSSLFSSLTQRQIRVLEEAMTRGYYEVPRRTSIKQIAAALGLSESTTQEHLSRAEAKVVRAIAPYLRLYARTPQLSDEPAVQGVREGYEQ